MGDVSGTSVTRAPRVLVTLVALGNARVAARLAVVANLAASLGAAGARAVVLLGGVRFSNGTGGVPGTRIPRVSGAIARVTASVRERRRSAAFTPRARVAPKQIGQRAAAAKYKCSGRLDEW